MFAQTYRSPFGAPPQTPRAQRRTVSRVALAVADYVLGPAWDGKDGGMTRIAGSPATGD